MKGQEVLILNSGGGKQYHVFHGKPQNDASHKTGISLPMSDAPISAPKDACFASYTGYTPPQLGSNAESNAKDPFKDPFKVMRTASWAPTSRWASNRKLLGKGCGTKWRKKSLAHQLGAPRS